MSLVGKEEGKGFLLKTKAPLSFSHSPSLLCSLLKYIHIEIIFVLDATLLSIGTWAFLQLVRIDLIFKFLSPSLRLLGIYLKYACPQYYRLIRTHNGL